MLENQVESNFKAYTLEVEALVLKAINAKECRDNLLIWKAEGHNSVRFRLDDSEEKAPNLMWHLPLDSFLKGTERILFNLWEDLRECGEPQLADDIIRPKL